MTSLYIQSKQRPQECDCVSDCVFGQQSAQVNVKMMPALIKMIFNNSIFIDFFFCLLLWATTPWKQIQESTLLLLLSLKSN